MSPEGYTPKTMKKFISDGDKKLNNGLEDSLQSDRLKTLLEDKVAKEGLMLSYLAQMEKACEYYQEKADKDVYLKEPTWLDRNTNWSTDREISSSGLGVKRQPLPNSLSPAEFWKKNAEPILGALDYYKRALYYSGPEILAADKIKFIAKSICRADEIIIAYSTYLNHSDSYVDELLAKQDEDFAKKNHSFLNSLKRLFGFGNSEDVKEMYGLNPLMKKTIIWSYIKENHNLPILMDYLRAVNILLLDTKLRDMSPKEADDLFETILFFLQNTEDPIQQKNERFFRFKRGIHLYKNGNYEKAKIQFSAATEFNNLKEESPISIRLIMSHIFQSELMIAKCEFKLNDFKSAIKTLNRLENSLHNVDGRDGGKIEIELLKDYKNTKKETLKKLGRIREAEEMEE
jgi:tetratricopeptide (TPR) repeat protein